MPIEKSDEESGLPKATIDKLIQELTPEGYAVNKETRALLRESAHVFLNMVALEATGICDLEKKKTISIGHVYTAFEKFGFGSFIEECDKAAKNYDEYSKHKPSKQNKLTSSNKSLAELEELQKSLFKEAAERQNQSFGISNESDNEIENKES